jgi:hypothetical protein
VRGVLSFNQIKKNFKIDTQHRLQLETHQTFKYISDNLLFHIYHHDAKNVQGPNGPIGQFEITFFIFNKKMSKLIDEMRIFTLSYNKYSFLAKKGPR